MTSKRKFEVVAVSKDVSIFLPAKMKERQQAQKLVYTEITAVPECLLEHAKKIQILMASDEYQFGPTKIVKEIEYILRVTKYWASKVVTSGAWVRTHIQVAGVKTPVMKRAVTYAPGKNSAEIGRYYASSSCRANGKKMQIESCSGREKGNSMRLSVQGASAKLKQLLLGDFCQDFDFVNCHWIIASQMTSVYPGIKSVQMPNLQLYIKKRDQIIEEVADFYELATDGDTFTGFRKDMIKSLFLQLMYGGELTSWEKKAGCTSSSSKNNPFVVAVSREIEALKSAVFASAEWQPLASRLIQEISLQRAGQETPQWKRDKKRIENSAFSRILQAIEADHLGIFAKVLTSNGVRVCSLVYDGLIALKTPKVNTELLLRSCEQEIFLQTGFKIQILEKPLYGTSNQYNFLRADHMI